jgi:hypothetical protein
MMDFTPPPGTVFAQVGPNREAFQPGTQPSAHIEVPMEGATHAEPVTPFNPAGAPPPLSPETPIGAPPPKPKPAQKPSELNGLF